MKRILVAALFLLAGPPAWAGTFNLNATLVVPMFVLEEVQFSGSAVGVTSVGGGIAQVPGGLFPSQISTPISPPQSGLNKLTVMNFGLQGGTLDAGQATSPLGLQGTVNLLAGANPAGGFGLGPIGAGGTTAGLIFGIFPITLSAEPWQLGTFMIPSPFGPSQTLVGFDARTPNGAGLIQFVSPGTFSDFFGVGSGTPFPAGSTLTLQYVAVAEPVVWALLTGALCVIGRRRR
ncbi:MAG: hypothetical protein QNK05_00295 [Myxococcota bacterium]|nr:hypothetical protein [Myxococcota bacterium]